RGPRLSLGRLGPEPPGTQALRPDGPGLGGPARSRTGDDRGVPVGRRASAARGDPDLRWRSGGRHDLARRAPRGVRRARRTPGRRTRGGGRAGRRGLGRRLQPAYRVAARRHRGGGVDFDAAVAELATLVETLEREGDERALLLL